jgi:hypothetical protein
MVCQSVIATVRARRDTGWGAGCSVDELGQLWSANRAAHEVAH